MANGNSCPIPKFEFELESVRPLSSCALEINSYYHTRLLIPILEFELESGDCWGGGVGGIGLGEGCKRKLLRNRF